MVGVTEDVVAVSKPATWPVHSTGQHRKNTVAGVLEATRPDLGTLHPVHRLDKPVSGLLLFARHPAAADSLRELIQVLFFQDSHGSPACSLVSALHGQVCVHSVALHMSCCRPTMKRTSQCFCVESSGAHLRKSCLCWVRLKPRRPHVLLHLGKRCSWCKHRHDCCRSLLPCRSTRRLIPPLC